MHTYTKEQLEEKLARVKGSRDGLANAESIIVLQFALALLGQQPYGYLCRHKKAADEQRQAFPGEEPDYLWQYTHGSKNLDRWEADSSIEIVKLYAAPMPAQAPPKPKDGLTITATHSVTGPFLWDIMTTAVESSYEWFAFRDVVRLPREAEHGLSITSFSAIELDDDGGVTTGQKFRIDVEKIAAAIQRMMTRPYVHADHMASLTRACAENDAGMIDACLADCILQVACFDEVRYG